MVRQAVSTITGWAIATMDALPARLAWPLLVLVFLGAGTLHFREEARITRLEVAMAKIDDLTAEIRIYRAATVQQNNYLRQLVDQRNGTPSGALPSGTLPSQP